MIALVDTSAYYALAAVDDAEHSSATHALKQLVSQRAELLTTSYVVSETVALVQARLGLAPLALFRDMLCATTSIIWIDEALHEAAWDELERLGRRDVSLVDCSLAVAGREAGIEYVFAFDPHMELLGLTPVTPD